MEKIEYEWPGTGKLEINIDGNKSASLTFFPELPEGLEDLFDEGEELQSKSPTKAQTDQGIKDTKQHEKTLLNSAKEQKTENKSRLHSFTEITKRYQWLLKAGLFNEAIKELENLAVVSRIEKRFVDENEGENVDSKVVNIARVAAYDAKLTKKERYALWSETIFNGCTPHKKVNPVDGFFVFEDLLASI